MIGHYGYLGESASVPEQTIAREIQDKMMSISVNVDEVASRVIYLRDRLNIVLRDGPPVNASEVKKPSLAIRTASTPLGNELLHVFNRLIDIQESLDDMLDRLEL